MDITAAVASVAPTFTDISNELWRTYTFPTGEVTINVPVKLSIKRKPEGDSHRIIDANGISHYIPAGWIHLSWQGKSGAEFSF